MAVYKLNSKKSSTRDIKKIVGFTFIGVSSVAYLFLTGIWSWMFNVMLGVFGVFAYALFLILFVVGLALVNNRKYVRGVRYALSMIFMVYFLLCIIQLIIVGGAKDMQFFEYLGLNYTAKWTAGGIIAGFLNTILLFLSNTVGAYIILVLAFVLCLALFLDSLNLFRRESRNVEGKKMLNLQQKRAEAKTVEAPQKQPVAQEPVFNKNVNVVLDGNLKEEQKQEKRPLTTRELLGLDKKSLAAASQPNRTQQKVEEKKPQVDRSDPNYIKKLILTPPEINYEEYFKELNKPKAPPKEEVNKVVEEIKEEKKNIPESDGGLNINQQQNWDYSNSYSYRDHYNQDEEEPQTESKEVKKPAEEEFQTRNNPFARDNNADVDILSQADMILKDAVEEEITKNADAYEEAQENAQQQNTRPTFDRRNSFDRSGFNRDRNFSEMRRGGEFAPEFPQRNQTAEEEEEPVVYEVDQDDELNEPYEYTRPPLDLITTKSVDLSTLNDDVAEKRVLLENTLENFGTPAKVEGVVVGPAVTRYELEMPQGIPVSKIKSRAEDIALSLASEGGIRIEAPVPGRSVVGIEVPNKTIATVSLRDILESNDFKNAKSPLTFALGKDITGNIITCNMQKLTHLLVAGATNSGKSVCLNTIILSIIYKASPEDVKIVLIDPKHVEFTNYNELPHLIMPNVICETQKAINTLTWAVAEMDRRFDMLAEARVKNIDEYNDTEDVKSKRIKKMPFIVIIIDELADLMMTGKKDVEEKIIRLAQKARAAGIHLILATQRPSVNVVTGTIKSNIPSRISFSTVSAVDSMTILDRIGAEKLLGKGDMLYYPVGSSNPTRVQGCFVSTPEINNIVDFVKANNKSVYDKRIEQQINNPNQRDDEPVVNDKLDDLFPYALKAAIECGQASTTMLRRRFAIGFSRAARIIDQLEQAGYISTADGAKGRTVYCTEEQFLETFGDKYNK